MANSFLYKNSIRLFLYQHKTAITAIATAIGAFALGIFFKLTSEAPIWEITISLGIFAFCTALTVFVSISPEYYEKIRYAESFLPALFDVLGLDKSARITIHRMLSKKRQTYEQVTDYFPTRTGKGRHFDFTRGITGQAFRTRISHVYSIPTGTLLAEDYKHRWPFTDDEISRITQDRRSYYAYPIGQDGSFALAVLYMDSADQTMFSAEKKVELDSKMEKLFLPTLEELLGIKR